MSHRLVQIAAIGALLACSQAIAQDVDPPAPKLNDPAALAKWEAAAAIDPKDWKRVDATESGVYWRGPKASKTKDVVSVDMRIERFIGVKGEDGTLFRSQQVGLQFDCAKGMMKAAKSTAFEKHNLAGRKQEKLPAQTEWSKVTPQAPAGQILDSACKEAAAAANIKTVKPQMGAGGRALPAGGGR